MNIFSANNFVAGAYYILMTIIAFFSAFGIYILLRYGKSRIFSLTISAIYGFIFLSFLAVSQNLLRSILKG